MKRVLIVDDTKNIRTLLTKCLQAEGCEVVSAVNGSEGKELLMKERFDLAFIDIKMPLLSGTEVIRAIRNAGIQTPVIVITAYATVKNAVETTQMGALAYLQKPFTADKVRSVIQEVFPGEACRGGEREAGASVTDAASTGTATIHVIQELLDDGAYEKALEQLKAMLAAAPEDPNIYRLMGLAHQGLGNRQLAEKFKKAHELFMDS